MYVLDARIDVQHFCLMSILEIYDLVTAEL